MRAVRTPALPALWLPVAAVLILSALAHAALLPARGFVPDLDLFVSWTHGIAVNGIGHAYDMNLGFPPVMVYVWTVVGSLSPAFRVVTDSSDVLVRELMKLPASLADLGLATGVAWYLRDRPRWAVIGAAAIALNPAVILDSAWWGQYDSVFVLFGLSAFLFATSGRRDMAAIALALALMTKPQALPLAIPVAAWFLTAGGLRGLVRAGVVSSATVALVWLPFVAQDGVANYARNVVEYQGGVYAVLSINAWNPWILVQLLAGGQQLSDATAFFGPISLRLAGYMVASLLELVVFLAVLRDPSPRRLAVALAAAVLVAFEALTSMHERYAFAAIVFMALLVPEARFRVAFIAFSGLIAAQLVAPFGLADATIAAAVSTVGTVGMLGVTGFLLADLLRARVSEASEAAAEGGRVPPEVVRQPLA